MTEESLDYPGFYYHPRIKHLLISKDGKFIDLNRLCCPLLWLGKSWEYYFVNVSQNGSLLAHRLLAATFIDNELDIDLDKVVNHINGIKTDLRLENLEVVSRSENATHAYISGLRDDNIRIESKNLITGEIKEFYSLNQCAREFKVNPEKVSRYLKSSFDYPFEKTHTLRKVGEDWRVLDKTDVGKTIPGSPQLLRVKDLNTNEVVIFPSASVAAGVIGATRTTILKYARNKQVLLGKYLIDLFSAEKSESNTVAPNRKPFRVRVHDTDTKTSREYDSLELFAKSVGCLKNTMQKSILINKGKWGKYEIEYLKS